MVVESPNIRYYVKAGAIEVHAESDGGRTRLRTPCISDDTYLHRTVDAFALQHESGFVVCGEGLEDFLSKPDNLHEYADLLIYAMTKDMTPIRTEVDMEVMRGIRLIPRNNSLYWSFPKMSGFEHYWYRSLETAMAGLVGTGYESPASRDIWEDRIRSYDMDFPLGYVNNQE